MPRLQSVPSYRRHKQSGQAIVTLVDGLGGRRDVLLGKYATSESRAAYARVLAEWEAGGRRPPARAAESSAQSDLSVNELAVAFLEHAERHYRHADGTPTRELPDYKMSLRPLCHLYGHSPAAAFGPLALKAVREVMVSGYIHPRHGPQEPLSRGVVNQRIGRIKRMVKWAVGEELVPPTVLQGLLAVGGLQRGRSAARETEPVKPVAESVVLDTLPYLSAPARALVQVQLLTGCRPGEAVIMRACDLDMSGPVWLYRPGRHKTEHHGHGRVIAIGPQAQEIIRPFLTTDTERYLFSPRDAIAAFRAELRKNRKTPVQPSQVNRKKRKPKRQPGEHYTNASYGMAIREAIKRHNRDKPEGEKLPTWHVHQLRHTAATKLRREYGLDVARAVLGHHSPAITELYAELDTSRAAEVMQRLG